MRPQHRPSWAESDLNSPWRKIVAAFDRPGYAKALKRGSHRADRRLGRAQTRAARYERD